MYYIIPILVALHASTQPAASASAISLPWYKSTQLDFRGNKKTNEPVLQKFTLDRTLNAKQRFDTSCDGDLAASTYHVNRRGRHSFDIQLSNEAIEQAANDLFNVFMKPSVRRPDELLARIDVPVSFEAPVRGVNDRESSCEPEMLVTLTVDMSDLLLPLVKEADAKAALALSEHLIHLEQYKQGAERVMSPEAQEDYMDDFRQTVALNLKHQTGPIVCSKAEDLKSKAATYKVTAISIVSLDAQGYDTVRSLLPRQSNRDDSHLDSHAIFCSIGTTETLSDCGEMEHMALDDKDGMRSLRLYSGTLDAEGVFQCFEGALTSLRINLETAAVFNTNLPQDVEDRLIFKPKLIDELTKFYLKALVSVDLDQSNIRQESCLRESVGIDRFIDTDPNQTVVSQLSDFLHYEDVVQPALDEIVAIGRLGDIAKTLGAGGAFKYLDTEDDGPLYLMFRPLDSSEYELLYTADVLKKIATKIVDSVLLLVLPPHTRMAYKFAKLPLKAFMHRHEVKYMLQEFGHGFKSLAEAVLEGSDEEGRRARDVFVNDLAKPLIKVFGNGDLPPIYSLNEAVELENLVLWGAGNIIPAAKFPVVAYVTAEPPAEVDFEQGFISVEFLPASVNGAMRWSFREVNKLINQLTDTFEDYEEVKTPDLPPAQRFRQRVALTISQIDWSLDQKLDTSSNKQGLKLLRKVKNDRSFTFLSNSRRPADHGVLNRVKDRIRRKK